METDFLKQLKKEFYDWCWLLSVDEIASNLKLLRTIERVERILLQLEANKNISMADGEEWRKII